MVVSMGRLRKIPAWFPGPGKLVAPPEVSYTCPPRWRDLCRWMDPHWDLVTSSAPGVSWL